jgi:N-acetylmuramoyl-L-alanine amidase
MRKVFLSAGHGGTDPGASGNGYIERDLAIELRNLLVNELKALKINPLTDDNRNALKDTLAWLRGKFGSKDLLIDIHWNAAANPEAKGSEVIIPNLPTYFETSFAKAMLKVFTDLGFRDRGVKPESLTARKSLAWMRPTAENILIEVCFISNSLDMKLYQANKNTIAKRLAAVINQYAKL